MAVLRDVIAGLPIGNREGRIFHSERGLPWGSAHICYTMSLRKAMKRCWQERGVEALRHFQCHHLRATFASAVRAQGADVRVLQVFLGHSRGDVLGTFYEQISVDRMRAVIVPAIEKFCDTYVTAHETGQAANGEV